MGATVGVGGLLGSIGIIPDEDDKTGGAGAGPALLLFCTFCTKALLLPSLLVSRADGSRLPATETSETKLFKEDDLGVGRSPPSKQDSTSGDA